MRLDGENGSLPAKRRSRTAISSQARISVAGPVVKRKS